MQLTRRSPQEEGGHQTEGQPHLFPVLRHAPTDAQARGDGHREYMIAVVEDSGIQVDQLFFHDPDVYMVETRNCDNLPVLPLSSSPLKFPYLKREKS